MIFNTLYPHARFLFEKNLVGQNCFVLKESKFVVDEFRESFESNLKQSSPKKKLNLPILFYGQVNKTIPARYCRSNVGNASNYTFKKVKEDNKYPEEWFPWFKTNNLMKIEDFVEMLLRFNEADSNDVKSLFASGGSLYTFDPVDDLQSLARMVSSSVCQPVLCNSPTCSVHSILALNTLNINAALFGETEDTGLIPAHVFKFCLMFWMLNKMKIAVCSDQFSEKFDILMTVNAAGTFGNISSLPLLIDIGHCWLGMHTDFIDSDHPIIKKFVELTQEKEVDSVKIGSKTYTAPATGKAPTNAYRTPEGDQSLSPEVRLGFERESINPVLSAYSNLIQNTRFGLSKTALSYYIFPEDHFIVNQYIKFLEVLIGDTAKQRDNYFKVLKKSAKSPRAKEEKQNALKRLQKSREKVWSDFWNKFKLSNLIFAFEENVGSTNQAQYSWTKVYRNLPAAKTFLFLNMLNNPEQYGRLARMLEGSSKNLSEGWREREIKRLCDHYFLTGSLNQMEYWLRWRKYIVRNNFTEDEFDPGLWEGSMSLIIQLKTMLSVSCSDESSGTELLKNLEKGRAYMNQKNTKAIQDYLCTIFAVKDPGVSTKPKEKKAQILSFVITMAESYGTFVDTGRKGWETIVDGLICGWGLKQICKKIRNDSYTSLIGGKNLAKHTPGQLRSLMIDLHNKAERSGSPPWNVQVPEEIAFKWSQQSGNKPETQIFMDAVFLGFMRWDGGVSSFKNDVMDNNLNNHGED